jgi:hypothetical protein
MSRAGRELTRVRFLKKGFETCGAIPLGKDIVIGAEMLVGNQRIQFTPSLRVLVKSEFSVVRSPTDTTYHHRFFVQYHGEPAFFRSGRMRPRTGRVNFVTALALMSRVHEEISRPS